MCGKNVHFDLDKCVDFSLKCLLNSLLCSACVKEALVDKKPRRLHSAAEALRVQSEQGHTLGIKTHTPYLTFLYWREVTVS